MNVPVVLGPPQVAAVACSAFLVGAAAGARFLAGAPSAHVARRTGRA